MALKSNQDLSLKDKLIEHFSYKREEQFIRAAYYFGHKHYTYPGNYLSSIRDEDVEPELTITRQLGFNTIVLPVSWAELEPEIGKPCEHSFAKLKKIVLTAQQLGLKILFRMPYLWSLRGENNTNRNLLIN